MLVFVVLLVLKVLKDDEERLFAKKDDDETKLAAANILFDSRASGIKMKKNLDRIDLFSGF